MTDRERAKYVSAAEKKAGITEGHYLLAGRFVKVWVEFYPRERWMIADCSSPRPEPIKSTARVLDDETKSQLEPWL